MSSLVTSVPGAQFPEEAGPGWHACVNAPATTTSPLTTAMLYTVECAQSRPLPNHCASHLGLPANTLGVQETGACDTAPGCWMLTADGARATDATGVAVAADALPTSSPPLASSAMPLAIAVMTRALMRSPR